MQVGLLDGVFLAVLRPRALVAAGVAFDERFSFHHYDMDFARAAAAAGLRVGTWPIALTHHSTGNYDSDAWRESEARYEAKWAAHADGGGGGSGGGGRHGARQQPSAGGEL